jgi:outer membrane protein
MTLLAAALASAVPLFAQAEDLVQIYAEARAADPSLALADANKGATEEGVPQARAALLPQINASLGYNHTDGFSGSSGLVTQPDGSLDFGFVDSVTRDRSRPAQATLTQSLFNWTNWTRLAAARSQAASANSNYDAASQDLFVRTSTAYFGVLTAQDALAFAQANEKALARQLDQAEQRFEVGLSAITDVHNARANHDSSVARVILSQNNVDNAREALTQIIGKDFGEPEEAARSSSLTKPEPTQLQEWVDIALKQNPSLASANYLVDAAEHNISLARSGHYPTLSASVVRTDVPGWGNSTQIFNTETFGPFHGNSLNNNTAIGVTLNVPIFTGGLSPRRYAGRVFQRDAAQDQAGCSAAWSSPTRNAYRAVLAGIQRSRGDQAGRRFRAELARCDTGRIRSRHAHDRRGAADSGTAVSGTEQLLAGTPPVRAERAAVEAGGRHDHGQGPRIGQRTARVGLEQERFERGSC